MGVAKTNTVFNSNTKSERNDKGKDDVDNLDWHTHIGKQRRKSSITDRGGIIGHSTKSVTSFYKENIATSLMGNFGEGLGNAGGDRDDNNQQNSKIEISHKVSHYFKRKRSLNS